MSTENTTYALQVAATNGNGFPEEQRGLEPPPTVSNCLGFKHNVDRV